MGSCIGKMRPARSDEASQSETEATNNCVIVEATASKTASVIFLHGLGERSPELLVSDRTRRITPVSYCRRRGRVYFRIRDSHAALYLAITRDL